MEFLDHMFYSATTDRNDPDADAGLWELYEEQREAAAARMRLALRHARLEEQQAVPVMNVWKRTSTDLERQGFINGFRFAMMLSRELLGTAE